MPQATGGPHGQPQAAEARGGSRGPLASALQRAIHHLIRDPLGDTDYIEVSKPWVSDSNTILSKPLRGTAMSPNNNKQSNRSCIFFSSSEIIHDTMF